MKDQERAFVAQRKSNTRLQLGENAVIDAWVVLGYPPSSDGDCSSILIIGPNAHIRHGTVIYAGSCIGCGLETGHNVVIRERNVIGDKFRIWSNSTIDYGCRIGSNVKIHQNVYVAQFTIIENDAFVVPGVFNTED